MTSPYAEEITANLERAKRSLQAARELAARGYPDVAASRAYYVAFYAGTALLLKEGLEFSKHSGLIGSIHQRFVKTGKLDKQCGKDLNWLFELRNVGDYGVTVHVSEQDALRAIQAAERFLDAVESIMPD
jgi:uncharacterized protein (UPF0332 family)